eukprot:COSAG01_NODE_9711_length_2363_cov_64.269876_2_plen_119_part_00
MPVLDKGQVVDRAAVALFTLQANFVVGGVDLLSVVGRRAACTHTMVWTFPSSSAAENSGGSGIMDCTCRPLISVKIAAPSMIVAAAHGLMPLLTTLTHSHTAVQMYRPSSASVHACQW